LRYDKDSHLEVKPMTRKPLEHSLHEYVKLTLKDYFEHLDEEKPLNIYAMVISEVEKAIFKTVLKYAKNNQSKAAAYLGLSRSTLRKKLREYDLDDNS
jgi:Fis family transcriptional regulator